MLTASHNEQGGLKLYHWGDGCNGHGWNYPQAFLLGRQPSRGYLKLRFSRRQDSSCSKPDWGTPETRFPDPLFGALISKILQIFCCSSSILRLGRLALNCRVPLISSSESCAYHHSVITISPLLLIVVVHHAARSHLRCAVVPLNLFTIL